MTRKIAAIGLAALAALVVAFGVVAYSYLKPTEAASGRVQAQAIAHGTTGGNTIYTIDQTSSQARFVVDEVLNGSPTTVVGTTNQVSVR